MNHLNITNIENLAIDETITGLRFAGFRPTAKKQMSVTREDDNCYRVTLMNENGLIEATMNLNGVTTDQLDLMLQNL